MSPPGGGMSVMANQLMLEQVAKGGTIMVVDVGQSTRALHEQVERNAVPVAAPKVAPYYRQFDKRKF